MDDAGLRDQLAVQRTHLANERTLLAYVRTALALAAGGAGLIQFFPAYPALVLGAWSLIAGGAIAAVLGAWRFFAVRAQIRRCG